MNHKTRNRILIIIISVVQVIVLLFLLLIALLTMWTNTSKDVEFVESFGDNVMLTSKTSQMSPTYGKSDVLFFDKFSPGEDTIEKDDIVCFYNYVIDGTVYRRALTTARIAEVMLGEINTYHVSYDGIAGSSGLYLNDADIVGVYTGGRLPGMGTIVESLAGSQVTFLLVVLLPMGVIFILDGGFLIHLYLKTRDDEDEESDENSEIENTTEA